MFFFLILETEKSVTGRTVETHLKQWKGLMISDKVRLIKNKYHSSLNTFWEKIKYQHIKIY